MVLPTRPYDIRDPESDRRTGDCLAITPNLLSPAQSGTALSDCMLQLGLSEVQGPSVRAVKFSSAPQPGQPCKMIGFLFDHTTWQASTPSHLT